MFGAERASSPEAAADAAAVSTSPAAESSHDSSVADVSPASTASEDLASDASTDASTDATGDPDKKGKRRPPSAPMGSIWIWQKPAQAGSQPDEEQKKKNRKHPAASAPWLEEVGNPAHLRGWANLGFNLENSDYGASSQEYRNTATEVGGDLTGVIYHPNFLGYGIDASWVRNGSAYTHSSGVTSGLQYNGSVSLLSARPYGLTLYFLRNNSDADGLLLTPFSYRNQNAGVRGKLIFPKFALMSYGFEQGRADTILRTRNLGFDDRYRSGNFTAQRALAGFDLTFSDDYFRDLSHYSDQLRSNNYGRFRLGRRFRENVQTYVRAFRSDFSFEALSSPQSWKNHVNGVDGGVDWKVSQRVTTFASGSLTRNALNTVELAATSGLPQINSLDSQSATIGGGANFSVTNNFVIGTVANYSDSGIPAATLALLSEQSKQGLITKSLSASLTASYNRAIRRWNNTASGGITPHRYRVASNNSDTGLDWFVSDSISGGDDRSLRYGFRYGFSRSTNPVFFNLLANQDHTFAVTLASHHFSWARLTGDILLDQRSQNFAGYDQKMKNYQYRATATRSSLTAYYTHANTDANQFLFGIGGLLLQPKASTGAEPLQQDLFRPAVLARTRSDTLGVAVAPRTNLRIDTRYLRGRYSILAASSDIQNYWSWDTNVQYKFGRFEMTGGYVKLSTRSSGYLLDGNRFYFRVHIPFQVF